MPKHTPGAIDPKVVLKLFESKVGLDAQSALQHYQS
jgi:hypothetical protein